MRNIFRAGAIFPAGHEGGEGGTPMGNKRAAGTGIKP
jgi:hypothetical protein